MEKFNCFVYAFGLQNDSDFTYLNNIGPKRAINIEYLVKYCLKITQLPQKGDYIFYIRDKKITHAGIVIDKNLIISKWGTEVEPKVHKIEDAFGEYGNEVLYYQRSSPQEIKQKLYSL